MIYYVCKYTPIEIFKGFDEECERLEPLTDSFENADSLGHPNLCGYGKAVIETILSNDIRELVLVNCCDVIRRIYDILKNLNEEKKAMDFLYLLDVPHKNGPDEEKIFSESLRKMVESYSSYSGRAFNFKKSYNALQSLEDKKMDKPYISISGAHGGAGLYKAVSDKFSIPVKDDTCTGIRSIRKFESMPESEEEFFKFYSHALLHMKPCMRMEDVSGRKEPHDDNKKGIIYHTMKFCDYYSFEYMKIKNQCNEPLLKIETDGTMQSEGQLRTRIEAFAESIGASMDEKEYVSKGRGYAAGIDSGSTSTDVVIMDRDKNIVSWVIIPTGAGAAIGAEKALKEAMDKANIERKDISCVVTTGYGRENIGEGDFSVTEITCHAKGANFLNKDVRTVIDIGGQDSKVIRIDEKGNVENFVMNDKCAAGTGRFLEMMARTLELSLRDMSAMGLKWNNDVTISSMCTVFAESEVVSLVARNTPAPDIIHGLNKAVAGKTVSLVKRVGGRCSYMMTGGVARNEGIVKELEEKLQEKVWVSDKSQICGAIGAALIGLEKQD